MQQWRGLGWRRASGRLRSLLKVVPLWWWWEWAEVWNPRCLAAWTWWGPSKSSSLAIPLPEQSLRCIGLGSMELAPWTHIGLTLLQLLFISCLPRGTVSKRVHSMHGWMFPLPLLWSGGFDFLLLSWEVERSEGMLIIEGADLFIYFLLAPGRNIQDNFPRHLTDLKGKQLAGFIGQWPSREGAAITSPTYCFIFLTHRAKEIMIKGAFKSTICKV